MRPREIELLLAGDSTYPDDLLFPSLRAQHIMTMPATQRRWTAAEVRQLIAESPSQTPRYELVDGELLVTPSPSGPHQRAVTLLLTALNEYLAHNPVGVVYVSPIDVELEAGALVQPDVFVVSPNESRRMLRELPVRELLVAAEVLSPSSGRHDRVTKRRVYARHVPEYWVVDLDARLIERWPMSADRPEVTLDALEWRAPGTTQPFRLDLPKYFASIFHELNP